MRVSNELVNHLLRGFWLIIFKGAPPKPDSQLCVGNPTKYTFIIHAECVGV